MQILRQSYQLLSAILYPDTVARWGKSSVLTWLAAVEGGGYLLAQLVVLLLMYAFSMGNHPLIPSMEPRFAEVIREMMARGEYLIPIKNGVPYIEYPPLYYWLSLAGSSRCGSDPSAWCSGLSIVGTLACASAMDVASRVAVTSAGADGRGAAWCSVSILYCPERHGSDSRHPRRHDRICANASGAGATRATHLSVGVVARYHTRLFGQRAGGIDGEFAGFGVG